VQEVTADKRRIVVLEDIVDHTNVGAIFRCAAGLGVEAVVLSPRCADPLYRRSIKVGMGAVFALPWARMDNWYDAMAVLSAQGFTTLALSPAADAVPIQHVSDEVRGQRLALVLGSEGPGLSPRWLHSADQRVRIPMTDKVDSLNVAAAAAIACYELMR
jgi:tRNA G18 (ribose-2'-O)-methylase SpoU